MAEAGRDGSIFDTPVLVDGGLSCGQYMLKTSKGSLESCMANNRLVCERDIDTHRRQGCGSGHGWSGEETRGDGEGDGSSDSGEEVWLIRVGDEWMDCGQMSRIAVIFKGWTDRPPHL